MLFNSSSVMWSGGFSLGPRYLLPMLPWLALPLALALARCWPYAAGRGLIAILLGWSIFAVWAETLAGQSFPGYERDPLWSMALPSLAAGEVARNWGTLLGLPGLWSLLPLLVLVGLLLSRLAGPLSAWPGRSAAAAEAGPKAIEAESVPTRVGGAAR
jgi:hypothetical protein